MPENETCFDVKQIALDLAKVRRSAALFSSSTPRLIDKYDQTWVAVLDGEVKAKADEFRQLLRKMDKVGISRRHALIRRINRNRRTLIV